MIDALLSHLRSSSVRSRLPSLAVWVLLRCSSGRMIRTLPASLLATAVYIDATSNGLPSARHTHHAGQYLALRGTASLQSPADTAGDAVVTGHGTGSLGHRVSGSFGSSFTSGSPGHHFDPL